MYENIKKIAICITKILQKHKKMLKNKRKNKNNSKKRRILKGVGEY